MERMRDEKKEGEGRRKEGRKGEKKKREGRRGRGEERNEKLALVVPARASRRCFVAPVLIVRNVVRL